MRDVLISLGADLAQSYIEVRTYQARLAVVRESITSQTESRQITLWRYQAGLTDELPVRQAFYSLESAKSRIPTLESSLSAAMNRVAVLTEKRPGQLHALLSDVVSLPELFPTVAVGLPADVIRRRPDIQEAENEFMAQTAADAEEMIREIRGEKLLGPVRGMPTVDTQDLAKALSRLNLPCYESSLNFISPLSVNSNIGPQATSQ
ncbi:hypothetical protein JCM12294_46580 [Desulfocicer niacini]